MNKTTKIALAAGALALVGAGGFASFAAAEKGKGGWHGGHHAKHASYSKHGYGHGRHGKGRGYRVEYMLERFDINKDGKLTQVELDEARTTLLTKHDADKNGKLSLEEFQNLWLEVMRKRMVRGFQRLDGDGDAVITVEEFIKPYSNTVERMDRNDDGAISRDDRKHHRSGNPAPKDDKGEQKG